MSNAFAPMESQPAEFRKRLERLQPVGADCRASKVEFRKIRDCRDRLHAFARERNRPEAGIGALSAAEIQICEVRHLTQKLEAAGGQLVAADRKLPKIIQPGEVLRPDVGK